MATCDYTTLADLDGLDGLSPVVISQRVRECPVLCRILFGEGNPDLFGIGVSYSSHTFTIQLL